MDHAGSFHKGFLVYAKEGGYISDVRRNSRSQKVEWQLPLPNFKQNWTNLVGDDVLIPGHSTGSSFLTSSTSNNALSANFVSAKNLLGQYPPSLLQALHPSNPDKQVWLDSYHEEKGRIQQMNVFERIRVVSIVGNTKWTTDLSYHQFISIPLVCRN